MKYTVIKYLSVVFILSLFIVKGVVIVLPAFAGFFDNANLYEMQLNNDTEANKEKNAEKEIEIKEFVTPVSQYADALKYAFLSNNSFVHPKRFTEDVFLSITTPPPKQCLV